MHLAPGVTIDRYRLLAPAGEGGQGSVWRAEDPLRPGSLVALKLVPTSSAPPASLERFRREARALARLAHPSLPRCHALFEDLQHDLVGIALDFIDGSPLSVLLTSERLTTAHRIRVVAHIAAALAYIHGSGLVHRDVKPHNVMIADCFFDHPEDPEGVKLVDFGIAAEPHNPSPLTATGSVMGTIEYLAPELLDRGHWQPPADGPERDVFALGVLAFELLQGKHPTGVPVDAALGDYLIAYRQQENDAFPLGIAGDPLERFYRGCLSLPSRARAPDGAAALALLAKADPAAVMQTGEGKRSLEHARTEAVDPARMMQYEVPRRSRLRSFVLYSSFAVGTAVAFAVGFYATFSSSVKLPAPRLQPALAGLDREKQGPNAEEPPNPETPAKPSRPLPSVKAPAAAPSSASSASRASSSAASAQPQTPVAFPSTLTCPEGMEPIGGPPPFCIDKREVTVADYRKCAACGPAKEAYWIGPSFTDKAKNEQTANCTNTRVGLDNYPINCVSLSDAQAYCAGSQKRLPRMDEWRKARSSIQMCNEVGGVCPLFEWSSDEAKLAGYRQTRGPSFRYPTSLEGSNIEVARNDDLGFRCAREPLVK